MAKPPPAGLDDVGPAVAVHPGEVHARTLLAGRSRSICAPSSTHLRPGILLDRDGTIIVDHGYVGSVDRVEFIEGGAGGDCPVQKAIMKTTYAFGAYNSVESLTRACRRMSRACYCVTEPDGKLGGGLGSRR